MNDLLYGDCKVEESVEGKHYRFLTEDIASPSLRLALGNISFGDKLGLIY